MNSLFESSQHEKRFKCATKNILEKNIYTMACDNTKNLCVAVEVAIIKVNMRERHAKLVVETRK